MRVLLLGGMPPALYRGGLEIQRDETAAALRRLGAEVVGPEDDAGFDVLHVLGADPGSWHLLQHWDRSAPLVVSPVAVFRRARGARTESLLRRIRVLGASSAVMRGELVRAADAVVALHHGERRFLVDAYGLPADRVVVVPNGSPARSAERPGSDPAVVAVGVIGPRKNQLALVRAWRPEWPALVLIGPIESDWAGGPAFVRAVADRPNVEHVGALPRQEVWDRQAGALATVSASTSEGESLALLDSLRLGRPVIVPAEAAGLADRYADGVVRYHGSDGLGNAVRAAADRRGPVPAPPSWDDVAALLLPVYERAVGGGRVRRTSDAPPAAAE